MGDELSFDNILNAEDVENLFADDMPNQEESPEETIPDIEDNKSKEQDNTAEVNPEDLFGEPESVGSEDEDNNEDKGDTSSSKSVRPSPNKYIYSSIAKALKEEGIFPDLEDEVADNIKAPEDFRDLIENQIKSGLDERQRRIDDALNAGIEPTEIRKYENSIAYLENIKDSDISSESDEGENLRKQLIYQDFINRGYSKERAAREVNKSLNAGTDIEDAKEALSSNKDFFKEQYNALVEDAKMESEKLIKERRKKEEEFKKSLLEDRNFFGEIDIDRKTRQKIYDNIIKPVYKDEDTGNYYSALQKYRMENEYDFLKNVSLVFTLTNGFKNFGGLLKGKVKKEVSKSLRELENTLNSTARDSGGNLKFLTGSTEDSDNLLSKGWDLDV